MKNFNIAKNFLTLLTVILLLSKNIYCMKSLNEALSENLFGESSQEKDSEIENVIRPENFKKFLNSASNKDFKPKLKAVTIFAKLKKEPNYLANPLSILLKKSISGKDLQEIIKLLISADTKCLKLLFFDANSINSAGLESTNIENLELHNLVNSCALEVCKLPKKIKTLVLSEDESTQNFFKDEQLEMLPKDIKSLDISWAKKITGSFFKMLKNHKNLGCIKIGSSVEDDFIKDIPEEIQELDFSKADKIPEKILGIFKNLKIITLPSLENLTLELAESLPQNIIVKLSDNIDEFNLYPENPSEEKSRLLKLFSPFNKKGIKILDSNGIDFMDFESRQKENNRIACHIVQDCQ